MLVLTRNVGECLTIENQDGEKIVIKILKVRGKRISVGVEAPPEFAVRRPKPTASASERTGS